MQRSTQMIALERAIHLAGGPTKLARAIGTNYANLNAMRRRGVIPSPYVRKIESVTGVPASTLRPDLYANADTIDTFVDPDTPLGHLHELMARMCVATSLEVRMALLAEARSKADDLFADKLKKAA